MWEKNSCSKQDKFITDDFLYKDFFKELFTNTFRNVQTMVIKKMQAQSVIGLLKASSILLNWIKSHINELYITKCEMNVFIKSLLNIFAQYFYLPRLKTEPDKTKIILARR